MSSSVIATPAFLVFNTEQVLASLRFVNVNLWVNGEQVLTLGQEIEFDLCDPKTPDVSRHLVHGAKVRFEVFNTTAVFEGGKDEPLVEKLKRLPKTIAFEGTVNARDTKRFRLEGEFNEGSLNVLQTEPSSVGSFTRQS